MQQKTEWWKHSAVYQIYPRSFCDSNGDGIGDINGITSKLEYIQNLGTDVVWISPVYQSPGRDNGYDISDYRAINPEFGTMADFDRLLDKAHKLHLKVVMDLVVNHSSDQHSWFIESRKNRNNPKRDYYFWRDGKNGGPPNNWQAYFGGSAWTYDDTSGQYYLNCFSPHQPDLNWENPVLREEIYDMMRWWLDKGIDGWRLDAIGLISKPLDFPDGNLKELVANGPRLHEFMREMRVKALLPYDTITVGEASGVTLEEAAKYAASDGSELNMVFQFDQVELDGGETFKWNDRKIDLAELKEVFRRWQQGLFGRAWNSLYWNNHDQPRMVSRMGDEGRYREKSAKMFATCLHFMQGTPYVYQGEEIGMTNAPFITIDDCRDLETINAYQELVIQQKRFSNEEMMRYIRLKGRDNSRTPMQWTDARNAGFSDGTPWILVNPNCREINAAEQCSRDDSVFAYYKQVLQLRKSLDIVIHGNFELLLPDDKQLFVYTRSYHGQMLLVVCNFSDTQREFSMPQDFKDAKLLVSNEETSGSVIGPFGAAVYYKQ